MGPWEACGKALSRFSEALRSWEARAFSRAKALPSLSAPPMDFPLTSRAFAAAKLAAEDPVDHYISETESAMQARTSKNAILYFNCSICSKG